MEEGPGCMCLEGKVCVRRISIGTGCSEERGGVKGFGISSRARSNAWRYKRSTGRLYETALYRTEYTVLVLDLENTP